MKRVAIVQSNYIPWKGYFDLIAAVDEFVLYDDMQYTRRDWRNRNKIKTPHGLQWLSVPVLVKGKFRQAINETEIDGSDWAELHWRSLEQNYRRASYFEWVASWLAPVLTMPPDKRLSTLNRSLIDAICKALGIDTVIRDSREFELAGERTAKLANVCVQAAADVYVTGPSAYDYLDPTLFARKGIELQWFSYDGYSEYPQLWGPFEHHVSILDLLFNCGPDARQFMLVGRL